MLDKLEKADIPVATASMTFPIWAQVLMPWLQFLLAALGFVYLVMRIYYQALLIRRVPPAGDAEN